VRHPQVINMKQNKYSQFKLVYTHLWQVQISSNQQTGLNSKCSTKFSKLNPHSSWLTQPADHSSKWVRGGLGGGTYCKLRGCVFSRELFGGEFLQYFSRKFHQFSELKNHHISIIGSK
jgi:hypothetical protein